MKHHTLVALAACSTALACFGTETDNPVTSNDPGGIDYTSPDSFGPPPQMPPPCVEREPEERPFRPSLHASAQIATAQGPILAQAVDDGLVLLDVSDPAAPRELSRGAVRQVMACSRVKRGCCGSSLPSRPSSPGLRYRASTTWAPPTGCSSSTSAIQHAPCASLGSSSTATPGVSRRAATGSGSRRSGACPRSGAAAR